MKFSKARSAMALTAAAAMVFGMSACGSNGSANGSNDKTIEFWDPYPQYTDGAEWDTYVKDCAPDGYTIKRQGLTQNDVLNNLTTAVKADNAPDVVLLDNPFMPTAVDSGLITDLKDAGVKLTGFDKNIEGPGIVDGVQYGLAFGTNALGFVL